MPKEWYVSFHGGEEEASLNNIHVYSTDGMKLRKALNKKSLPEGTNFVSFADSYSGRIRTCMWSTRISNIAKS